LISRVLTIKTLLTFQGCGTFNSYSLLGAKEYLNIKNGNATLHFKNNKWFPIRKRALYVMKVTLSE
jgi:hypothetical protein